MHSVRLIASCATIPSRVKDGSLFKFLDSMLGQTRSPDVIYVCISKYYKRLKCSMPSEYIDKIQSYHNKVLVQVQDYDSPLIKHLGPYKIEKGRGAFQFVGDDDQVYHPDLLKRMLEGYFDQSALMQNRYHRVRTGSGGIVHGFVGCLYPTDMLKHFFDCSFYVPSNCWVDDQLMSIYCHKYGIRIIPSPVLDYEEIFATLEKCHEITGAPDALHKMGSREQEIKSLERLYNVKFINRHNVDQGRGIIIDA